MLTIQYLYNNSIESLRLPIEESIEYCNALEEQGIDYSIIN